MPLVVSIEVCVTSREMISTGTLPRIASVTYVWRSICGVK